MLSVGVLVGVSKESIPRDSAGRCNEGSDIYPISRTSVERASLESGGYWDSGSNLTGAEAGATEELLFAASVDAGFASSAISVG